MDDEHDLSVLEDVRALGAAVLRKPVTKMKEPLRKEVPVTKRRDETLVTKAPAESVKEVRPLITRRALGRPKKHKDAAARQRAYRERGK